MRKVLVVFLLAVTSCSALSIDEILNASTFNEAVALFVKEFAFNASHEGDIRRLRLAYFSLPKVPIIEAKSDLIPTKFKNDFYFKNADFLLSGYHKHPHVQLRDQLSYIDNANMSMKSFLEYQGFKRTSIVITDKEAVIILGVIAAVTVTVVGAVSYCVYKWVKNRKAQQDEK